MPVETFSEFESFVFSARKYFRDHAKQKQTEISEVFNLCFSFFKSIGKYKSPEEWPGSQEEYVFKVLTKAVQTILGMYFLSESGFYDLALSLKRNFSELLLISIAIGYDKQCFIDWKNERDHFKEFRKIIGRVQKSPSVPILEKKEFLPKLIEYWNESSQLHSHQTSIKTVEDTVKDGEIDLGVKIIKEDFEKKRMNTIRNMCLDVITVMVGVFDYGMVAEANKKKFPEALGLIKLYNNFQQSDIKNQPTI